jgi:hypothetical protein
MRHSAPSKKIGGTQKIALAATGNCLTLSTIITSAVNNATREVVVWLCRTQGVITDTVYDVFFAADAMLTSLLPAVSINSIV